MLETLSYSEYADWGLYFTKYPFKEDRADLRAAMIALYTVTGYVDPNKTKPKLEDFLFDFDNPQPKQTKPQTWEEQFAIAQQLTNLVSNGKDGKETQ